MLGLIRRVCVGCPEQRGAENIELREVEVSVKHACRHGGRGDGKKAKRACRGVGLQRRQRQTTGPRRLC